MRKLFRNLIVRMGKREQEESGSKEITPEDRVRALRERTEAFEQKPPAEELVPARRPPLTAPPIPEHSVEEPPTPRPEHGEYTSAESSTIPVFGTVRDAYTFLWHQRRDFVSLAAPAFVGIFILSTLLMVLFPEFFSAIDEGVEPEVPGTFVLIILPVIVIWVAVWMMFAVAWHRKYLVPDDDVTVRAAYHWRPRHTRFLGAAIVVGLWAGLTFVLVFFTAIAVSGPFTRSLWPEAAPEQWVLAMIGLVVWWIAELSAAFVAARYSMLLPSSTVGQRMSSAESWKFTRGNGWRLALICILIAIAAFVITLPIDLLSDSDGIIANVVAVLLDEFVWFVTAALYISVLSIAYRRLMAVMPPVPATGE